MQIRIFEPVEVDLFQRNLYNHQRSEVLQSKVIDQHFLFLTKERMIIYNYEFIVTREIESVEAFYALTNYVVVVQRIDDFVIISSLNLDDYQLDSKITVPLSELVAIEFHDMLFVLQDRQYYRVFQNFTLKLKFLSSKIRILTLYKSGVTIINNKNILIQIDTNQTILYKMLLKFQVFNQMFSTTTHCALVCPDILILNFNTKSCIKVAFQSGPIKFYSTKFPDHIFIQSGYNVYLISLISQKVIKNLQISSPIQLYNNFITYQTFYDSEYCLSYIYPTNSKINILLKIDRHLTRLIHIEDDYLIIGRFDGVCQIYSCVNYDCQPFKL